jgi:hypothetical protein
MKYFSNSILKFIGLIVLIAIISLVPELIGGDLQELLQEKLGDKYKLIVIGTGVTALLLYTFWSEGNKIFNRKAEVTPQKVTDDTLTEVRSHLLDSYENRLNSKLAYRYPINLSVEYSVEGTNEKAVLYDNKAIEQTQVQGELFDLFNQHRGRLLIIGARGAGKTTLLLQLAIRLLKEEPEKIATIVDLSTWRDRFSSIEEWLSELLPQIGFSKALTKSLLAKHKLLLLFDGLDELKAEERDRCLKAIAEYGVQQQARYVICSRIDEYASAKDAPVYCQLKVQPLSLFQIRTGLQEADSPEAAGILDAIDKDELLAEAIKTPFYLNTVQLLFARSLVWENFGF